VLNANAIAYLPTNIARQRHHRETALTHAAFHLTISGPKNFFTKVITQLIGNQPNVFHLSYVVEGDNTIYAIFRPFSVTSGL
jgi:hypothetical protein